MFTIFGLDVNLVLLNIPFHFEYAISIGDDHKKPHPPKKPHHGMAAATEEA
ncbi:hypothetical protein [Bacillus sp. B1-b2]|uniref:hypothetical protein n=1 Tax=Bacillus sp. B1-b2 TaxID=2653201 RepID=UPI001869A088|nr:hypothetical protein [Bacillus sp. B1-b2]